jgi:hypothetical protein
MKQLKNLKLSEICDLLNINTNQAKELKNVVINKITPEKYISVVRWIDQCYNKPKLQELKLCAINQIIEGYGVDVVYESDIFIDYINMGDTYTNTVLYFNGKYYISSWGDIYERYCMK